MGTAPNTRAAVTQKNKVYGYSVGAKKFEQLGAISEFGMDESRSVEPYRGVGFGDQVAELVPGVTEPLTLTLNKTLLYTANLFQVVGYKGGIDGIVRSLKHHRWPFDIKQELVFSELSSKLGKFAPENKNFQYAQKTPSGEGFVTNAPLCLLTFFEGCWFESYNTSYTSDAAIVAESSSVKVSDVLDATSDKLYGEFIDTGLAPIDANGIAGNGYSMRFAPLSSQSNALPPV
jgi:hypothetical protein